MWTVELQLVQGNVDLPSQTVGANVLSFQFPDLMKGTVYRARVWGRNERGDGFVSDYVVMETLIDRESVGTVDC